MGCVLQKSNKNSRKINKRSGSEGLTITTNSSELKNKKSKIFYINQISFKLSNITQSTIMKRRYQESPFSKQ